MKILSYPAIILMRIYKITLSPIFTLLGVKCRHYPSCSSYGIEAMEQHGFWGGGWMTLARLLRCHPVEWLGGTSGVDNVPKSITKPPLWAPWRYGQWRGTFTDENHGNDHIS